MVPPPPVDFGENCLYLAGNYFGDGSEAEAVFVAEGKIAEQIADRDDAASFESRGALRAYAVEIFDRVGEGDRHQMGASASLLYHRLLVREARLRLTSEGKGQNTRREHRKKIETHVGA